MDGGTRASSDPRCLDRRAGEAFGGGSIVSATMPKRRATPMARSTVAKGQGAKKQARPANRRKTKDKLAGSVRAGTAAQQSRSGTKQAALIALLERPAGATIAQMCAKTGWQPHSVRAALTGLRKLGLKIFRDANDAGTTVYRIDSKPERICS